MSAYVIAVVNLAHYQHYKNRRPPWVKLHRTVLESYDFGRLQDASKWLALGLTLLASECDNAIPYDIPWIKQRLQMTTEPDIEELVSVDFIEVRDASKPLADCKQRASKTLSQSKRESKSKRESQRKNNIPPDGGVVRTTWLTPYALAWDAKFGVKAFPFGQAAKYLRPIEDALGAEETARRLTRFVAASDAQFVTLARFAQTHGQYAEDRVSPQDAELQAIAEEARAEAYVNSDAVRLWESAQRAGCGTQSLIPFGIRSGLEGAIPAKDGASAGVSP